MALPHDNQVLKLLLANWILTAIAIPVVALRFYTSIKVFRKLSLPDYLMGFAVFFSLVFASLNTVATQLGIGWHIYDIPADQISTALRYHFLCIPFRIATATTARISFAIYLLRLIGSCRPERWILYVCIGLTSLVNTASIILLLTRCGTHPNESWASEQPHCSTTLLRISFIYNMVQGSANTLIDLTLTLISTLMMWNLRLPMRARVGLIILLSSSLFAAVGSTARTVELGKATWGPERADFTYSVVSTLIWATVENSIVIIAASIPRIRPLFKQRKDSTTLVGDDDGSFHTDSEKISGTNPNSGPNGFFFHQNDAQTSLPSSLTTTGKNAKLPGILEQGTESAKNDTGFTSCERDLESGVI